jgi:PTS system glucitol/sorbitol-specific IIB component
MAYQTVKVEVDAGGWGGPLFITPTEEQPYIASVTGGGIHNLAAEIAELSGGKAVDAFRHPPKMDEWACVVIDCGGAARCGVYPMKQIKTLNVVPIKPRGFFIKHMKPEIYAASRTFQVTLAEEEA